LTLILKSLLSVYLCLIKEIFSSLSYISMFYFYIHTTLTLFRLGFDSQVQTICYTFISGTELNQNNCSEMYRSIHIHNMCTPCTAHICMCTFTYSIYHNNKIRYSLLRSTEPIIQNWIQFNSSFNATTSQFCWAVVLYPVFPEPLVNLQGRIWCGLWWRRHRVTVYLTQQSTVPSSCQ